MTFVERLYKLVPLDNLPADTAPPRELRAFIWHFLRQIWPLLVLLVVLEACVAGLMTLMTLYLGWTVDMVSRDNYDMTTLAGFAAVVVVMPLSALGLWWIYDHVYTPQFGNMLRRQLHHYTLGHALAYYNNDYAGRIANKVLESGPALREIVRSSISAIWYAGFFALTVLVVLVKLGGYVAVPVMIWLVVYVTTLSVFVPRVRKLSMVHSEMHSTLVGRVVDTYTNIASIKLFGRQRQEDERGYATLREHTRTMRASTHEAWKMRAVIMTANALMMASTIGIAVTMAMQGQATVALVGMAIPMVWQLNNMSGWIMGEVTGVFENLGRVEECMVTLAQPHTVTDAPDAKELTVSKGNIRFKGVTFHYGRTGGVMAGFNLQIYPGEKVGLVGRSGAGKSTLVSLLLRNYDLERGEILVDSQNIAAVTQQSLREQIAVVTQESSLLNRSIRDNLLLGRPGATDAEVMAAAQQAHADAFIAGLVDGKGNRGLDAQVGERGVKLSGGQRQRIALARVFLKNAPVLILDEATSALDSEAEEAILESLDRLMQGKTVLAIAHRLSTLQSMDRIVVMDQGGVVEDGSHAALLKQGGLYASLWQKQSGGFLPE